MSLGLVLSLLAGLALGYLLRVNHLLKGVPSDVQKLSSSRWTAEQLRKAYDELQQQPINWTHKLPAKLERRYIVTGGNGEIVIRMRHYFVAAISLR
jgi:hypothetical protein